MPMVNPDTNEPVEDEAGNLVYVPVSELETELAHGLQDSNQQRLTMKTNALS